MKKWGLQSFWERRDTYEMSDYDRNEIEFTIKEKIGVIKPYPTGWNR